MGKIFRFSFPEMKESDLFIGKYVISKYIFIHLGKRNKKKSELLCFMIHKLLMLQKGHCLEDNPDAFDTQEFLLPGNLILINLKEQLNNVKTYTEAYPDMDMFIPIITDVTTENKFLGLTNEAAPNNSLPTVVSENFFFSLLISIYNLFS